MITILTGPSIIATHHSSSYVQETCPAVRYAPTPGMFIGAAHAKLDKDLADLFRDLSTHAFPFSPKYDSSRLWPARQGIVKKITGKGKKRRTIVDVNIGSYIES